jgi:hypothetical protein
MQNWDDKDLNRLLADFLSQERKDPYNIKVKCPLCSQVVAYNRGDTAIWFQCEICEREAEIAETT